jgi:hypothetical protein
LFQTEDLASAALMKPTSDKPARALKMPAWVKKLLFDLFIIDNNKLLSWKKFRQRDN